MVLVTTFLFFYFLFYCSENCTVYIKLHLKHILYLLFFRFSWWFTWYFHNSPLGYRDSTYTGLFTYIDDRVYLYWRILVFTYPVFTFILYLRRLGNLGNTCRKSLVRFFSFITLSLLGIFKYCIKTIAKQWRASSIIPTYRVGRISPTSIVLIKCLFP